MKAEVVEEYRSHFKSVSTYAAWIGEAARVQGTPGYGRDVPKQEEDAAAVLDRKKRARDAKISSREGKRNMMRYRHAVAKVKWGKKCAEAAIKCGLEDRCPESTSGEADRKRPAATGIGGANEYHGGWFENLRKRVRRRELENLLQRQDKIGMARVRRLRYHLQEPGESSNGRAHGGLKRSHHRDDSRGRESQASAGGECSRNWDGVGTKKMRLYGKQSPGTTHTADLTTGPAGPSSSSDGQCDPEGGQNRRGREVGSGDEDGKAGETRRIERANRVAGGQLKIGDRKRKADDPLGKGQPAGHDVWCADGLFWCRKCGTYGSKRVRGLGLKSSGGPKNRSAAGTIRRLRRGQHPAGACLAVESRVAVYGDLFVTSDKLCSGT